MDDVDFDTIEGLETAIAAGLLDDQGDEENCLCECGWEGVRDTDQELCERCRRGDHLVR